MSNGKGDLQRGDIDKYHEGWNRIFENQSTASISPNTGEYIANLKKQWSLDAPNPEDSPKEG